MDKCYIGFAKLVEAKFEWTFTAKTFSKGEDDEDQIHVGKQDWKSQKNTAF